MANPIRRIYNAAFKTKRGRPVGESVANLALMECIDKLLTVRPETGVRATQSSLVY